MPNVTRNLLGNFAGRGIGAALSLLLVPVYIRFLGVEAYGLVTFSLVVQTLIGVLDLGLNLTTNREIALRVAEDGRRAEARDLLRTIEALYWPLGFAIGAVVIAASPWIAGRWLQSETLSVGTIQIAIAIIGVTLAVQWPGSMYDNALHGLQRIVEFNAISAGMQIVRAAGGLFVVWMWPTVITFVAWQAVIGGVTTALLFFTTWRYMPAGPRPAVRIHLLTQVWRFAAGMTAITVLGVIILYSDRIVLSRLLPLEAFGYYGIASMVSTGLFYLMSPITLTVLPRFTELLAKGEREALIRTYHLSAQLLTIVLAPVAFVLALFSHEVVTIWTRDAKIAANTSGLVSILVTAMLLYAIVEMPYMMQLARGRTRLAVSTNLVSVVLYLPLLALMVLQYGATGAALSLLAMYSAKFLIWGVAAHTDVLRGEKWRWYFEDVARPAIVAAGVVIAARLLIPESAFSFWLFGLLLLGIMVAVAAIAAVLAAPLPRARAFAYASRFRQFVSDRKQRNQSV